uniref:Uncharacterized protein n=1 Tax=Monopterus albus TaxID=43700 RepID=A0A3Q3K244_MONAL|nr:5-hydroxytryptamine receptor 3A-like isoform X2 [Monopterus albus]
MMLAGFFFLLLLTDGASSVGNCSYQAVLKHLDLTRNNQLFYMSRPVDNHTKTTHVFLDVKLYAILDIKEKDQQFVPYVWITMEWHNDYIYWDPDQFCSIKSVSVPSEVMWKPDITIEEMTERDKAPPSPYLIITNNGTVKVANDQVLVSTCTMETYKFPFDIQRCTLTFTSIVHSVKELELKPFVNSAEATEDSREVMRTQSEWLFISMNVSNKSIEMDGFNQSFVIYTITMKRRSALYVVNFLLPILFFLCLDLVSFLISDSGGEKLSFKVTVLLAVTVMQLILNEILPSSSDKIPLVAIYCIGMFAMMMLSLVETIVVMYLIEKDSASQDDNEHIGLDVNCGDSPANFLNCLEVNKRRHNESSCSDSIGEMPSELRSVDKEDSDCQLKNESSEKLSGEAVRTLILLLNSMKAEGKKPGYWTRMTKIINKVFLGFYVTAAGLFLLCIFVGWTKEQD